jgi:hypothetical protein
VTDPAADPDGDGQTNAQRKTWYAPERTVQRFLAEGATGTFFHTAIALANPDPALPAAAVLTFDRGDGTRVRHPLAIPASRSAIVDVGAVTGLGSADRSTTIESDRLLGVQRTMTWGASPTAIYGSHAETATSSHPRRGSSPEGRPVLDFDLFYLLQNPQATTTHTPSASCSRPGRRSRAPTIWRRQPHTIYVNTDRPPRGDRVSGDITADAPIVVERAMVPQPDGPAVRAGHRVDGRAGRGDVVVLAEGATGTFFDLFVLIANPGVTDATVQAVYAKPDGTTVTRTYTVRAHSRFSVYVDASPASRNTSVGDDADVTNAVPISRAGDVLAVAGSSTTTRATTSAGSTSTALAWSSPAQREGAARGADLCADCQHEDRAGFAAIDVLRDVTSTQPPISQLFVSLLRTAAPRCRCRVDGSYGVRVLSVGTRLAAVQLVVESAVYYSDGGVTWSAARTRWRTPVP